ncbi:MAG TPA: glycosyltransferase family 39 protein [Bryobacteraceae bacterium]|nr:glycosyltransferase family 39 protein [Bryobacteraceae bacterium]
MNSEARRRGTSRFTPRVIAPLLAAVAIYLTLALWIAHTKAPWCDEGWFANPAYNLAFHGYMGSNVVEPSGFYLNTYLRGIHDRTYYVTPNHLVALAGWFRVFGFSLFSMRLYSILWGVVALLALFYILYHLFPNPQVAQLAVLLLSVDFIFLWSAADGRMEAPANALALCALAAYLYFREQRFGTAVLVSQLFLAAAVFTHPNALLVGIVIPVLAWRDDRQRIRPAHLLLVAAPYVVFAAPWALYILQSPAGFKAQFFANAAGRGSARWKVFLQPWRAVLDEGSRHLRVYLVSDVWSAEMNPWMGFVPFMYLGAIIWLFWNWKKRGTGMQVLGICVATVLIALTFLNGLKLSMYLCYAVPFYDAILAAWLLALWQRRGDSGGLALVIGFAFVFLQVTTSVMHIRADEYGRDYLPAIHALEQDRAEGKTIVGTAALGFGLHFQGFADDWRLGLYSHLDPDVLVIDRSYRQFSRQFEKDEPLVFAHTTKILGSAYRPTHRYGSFWLYERVPAHSQVASP